MGINPDLRRRRRDGRRHDVSSARRVKMGVDTHVCKSRRLGRSTHAERPRNPASYPFGPMRRRSRATRRLRARLGVLEYILLALIATGIGITIAMAVVNPAP
jgi:hypothetical protein